jgi:hypothetical protein
MIRPIGHITDSVGRLRASRPGDLQDRQLGTLNKLYGRKLEAVQFVKPFTIYTQQFPFQFGLIAVDVLNIASLVTTATAIQGLGVHNVTSLRFRLFEVSFVDVAIAHKYRRDSSVAASRELCLLKEGCEEASINISIQVAISLPSQ